MGFQLLTNRMFLISVHAISMPFDQNDWQAEPCSDSAFLHSTFFDYTVFLEAIEKLCFD